MEKKCDRRLFLKIKLQSLRDEAKCIRAHEERLRPHVLIRPGATVALHAGDLIRQMSMHRRRDLRDEARATLLAYSYIRGRKYEQVEGRVKWDRPYCVKMRVERVAKMVNKYSVMQYQLLSQALMEETIRAWMGVDKHGLRVLSKPREHTQVLYS